MNPGKWGHKLGYHCFFACINNPSFHFGYDGLCLKSHLLAFFSVKPQCPLCLRGCFPLQIANHRDTENTEVAQRRTVYRLLGQSFGYDGRRSTSIADVPRNQGFGAAVADGPLYTVMGSCPWQTKSRLLGHVYFLFFSSEIIGSQSSTLFLSGSMIHANFPFSSDCGPDTISTPFCFS